MRRSVKAVTRTTPVIDVELGEWQSGQFEESRPADAIDPVANTLPVFRIAFISMQDLLHDSRCFRPTRWIVRNTRSDQLLEARLSTRIGVITTNPDSQFSMLCIVNLHRRAGWVTGSATNTFLFVDFE